jgi:hypothetical protein
MNSGAARQSLVCGLRCTGRVTLHAVSDEPKSPEPSHQPESGVDEASDPPVGLPAPVAHVQQPGEGVESKPDTAKAEPPVGRRRRMVATILAVVLGGLTVLCVGGLGAGYLFYRQASEPDRSTPGVVVRQYLQATFDDRDKSKAARFTCGKPEDIGEIEQKLADIVSREKRFGIRITVGWENFVAEERKGTGTVTVRLKIEVPEQTGQSSESFQQWSFALRQQNTGWRVCGAQRSG